MDKERIGRIGDFLNRVTSGVTDKAPIILRPGGLGLGIASVIDHNFVVTGLSVTIAAGSALILEKRRAAKRRDLASRQT